MNIRAIDILTAADGTFVTDVNLTGEVHGVALTLGDATSLDLAITDKKTAATIYAKASITTATHAQPKKLAVSTAGVSLSAAAGPPAVDNIYAAPLSFGQVHVAVANGGDTKSAKLYIAYKG